MDGSFVTLLASHPAAASIAVAVACAVGWGLYRHSASCKEARVNLYAAVKENTDAVNRLAERVSALEAVSNMANIQEIAKIAKGL